MVYDHDQYSIPERGSNQHHTYCTARKAKAHIAKGSQGPNFTKPLTAEMFTDEEIMHSVSLHRDLAYEQEPSTLGLPEVDPHVSTALVLHRARQNITANENQLLPEKTPSANPYLPESA